MFFGDSLTERLQRRVPVATDNVVDVCCHGRATNAGKELKGGNGPV
jgi:hypothetical protein